MFSMARQTIKFCMERNGKHFTEFLVDFACMLTLKLFLISDHRTQKLAVLIIKLN